MPLVCNFFGRDYPDQVFYDAAFFSIDRPDNVPARGQDRAYTSLDWHSSEEPGTMAR